MADYLAVMKATVIVYLTFSPAIIIPCLLSLAARRQGKGEVR